MVVVVIIVVAVVGLLIIINFFPPQGKVQFRDVSYINQNFFPQIIFFLHKLYII